MKAFFRPNRYRSIALLLTGVLPLVVQPGALAGQIAASRYVDRVVADFPGALSIEDLLRLLDGQPGTDSESLPEDVASAIIQCRLFSLISDSVILQAPVVDQAPIGADCLLDGRVLSQPDVSTEPVCLPAIVGEPTARRLSDEQPLGP